MGNTYIPAKALLDGLGVDYVIPPFNSRKTLEIGTRYAPESACLPLKYNLGNFIQAYEAGADTVLMAGGCGPCRFGYYGEVEREILKDAGYPMDFITLELPNGDVRELIRRIRKLTGNTGLLKIIRAVKHTVEIAIRVDELERLCFKTRPLETEKGSVDRLYKAFQAEVLKTGSAAEIEKLIKKTREKLLSINVSDSVHPLRVGIVGEIYSTIDYHTGLYIESRLGNMGVEVDRHLTISMWVTEHVLKNILRLPKDLRFANAAKPYLGAMIGGHARETVGNAVLYAEKGYDGIIQIYPLTCMPEIVAQSILPLVGKERGIPILTLIVDEMTGEAGYMTRIEAFIDLLRQRRERPYFERKQLLPRC